MTIILEEGTYESDSGYKQHFIIKYDRNSIILNINHEDIKSLTTDQYNYFIKNIVNKKKEWITSLPGMWYNNNILIIIQKTEFNLFHSNKDFIYTQLSIDLDNDNFYFIDDISTVDFELKYKYIINFSMDLDNIKINIFKIEELLLSDGIFYCYDAYQELLKYMRSRLKFQPYKLKIINPK